MNLGRTRAPQPSPYAPGTIVILENGRSTNFTVQPGQRLVIGRHPGSAIVLDDPAVSPSHALVVRLGPGWLVSSLDLANPVRLLDPTGRAQPVERELGLRSGELLIGGCRVLLYPPGA